ncbi:MAG TPA: hypothetical protein VF786_14635 [Terriglobales bacterium]
MKREDAKPNSIDFHMRQLARDRRRVKLLVLFGALLLAVLLSALPLWLWASPAPAAVKVETSAAQPRQVEDSTAQAVQRDYAQAWSAMSHALDQNNASLLDPNFAGTAREKLGRAVKAQAANGLHRRIIDHGHSLRVTFYSLDGSAMQVEDTAQQETEYFDGGTLLKSEQGTVRYLAVLTPAESSWKVRILEAVPSF